MTNLLSFNPYFRMTAREVLTLKIFDEVRDNSKEKFLRQLFEAKDRKNIKISLAVDSDDAFDYDNASNAKYTKTDLKNILYEEILDFRQNQHNQCFIVKSSVK